SCCNPASKIATPRIDALAREGVLATDAHAPASVCSPTRYGLLTGRYAWRGRLQRGVVAPWGAPILEEDRLNLAGFLRDQGYSTGCFGKWHLGWDWPTKDGKAPKPVNGGPTNVNFRRRIGGGPIDRGFDTYFGVDLPNFPPYCFIDQDRTVGIPQRHVEREGQINRPGPVIDGWKQEEILPKVIDRAAAWIREQARSTKPFFAYIPLTSPHYPLVPTDGWQGKSGAGVYGDFVQQTDHHVGQILDALEGASSNTLVIFTSDNGAEPGEVEVGAYERIFRYGHDGRGGWRGVKRDNWEGGHRVPFVARWPGVLRAGSRSGQTICLTDLMATMAHRCGKLLPDNAAEDSFDMLPALQGRPTPRRNIGTVHQKSSGGWGLRLGDWVYIDSPSGNDNGRGEPASLAPPPHGQAVELFNLATDPAQRENRAASEPRRVATMKRRLDELRARGRSR
ncbi:MAG: sulfatase family protein, partial [Armatimonadaceae bacterium]